MLQQYTGGTVTTDDRVRSIASSERCERRFVVDGAIIVCSKMTDGVSPARMIATNGTGRIVQGEMELAHTDIEFEPLFTNCMTSEEEECCPDIEGYWENFDTMNFAGGGYGLLEENCFTSSLRHIR